MKLQSKPAAQRAADADRRDRLRRPKTERCSVCCHPSVDLDKGRCRDRVICAERQPYLFGSEAAR